jgi:hypothetical protein
MLLVHQALPHTHHGHEGAHLSSKNITSSLGVHTHHHHDEEGTHKENNAHGFLDFLMEYHLHLSLFGDVPEFKTDAYKQEISNNQIGFYIIPFQIVSDVAPYETNAIQEAYLSPHVFSDNYLSYLALRGPPFLA